MQADEFRYPRAPIMEALLFLEVTPQEGVSLDVSDGLEKSFGDEYAPRKELLQFSSQIDLATGSQSPGREIAGYRFEAPELSRIIQIRKNMYIFSQLAPYSTWREFVGASQSGWNAYREAFRPTGVTKLALRYVNRLDLPLPIRDFRDYLRTFPEVSSDLSQELGNFFLRVQLPVNEERLNLTVNLAPGESHQPDRASIILDIEIGDSPDRALSEDEIWQRFEVMRKKKNDVFEACITQRTRQLFQ